MKKLQRHWPLISVVCACVVLVGAFWMRSATESIAMIMPPEPIQLTAMDRDSISNIMDELHLDRDALIALNCSGTQARAIMGTCRTWSQSHEQMLSTHNGQIAARVHQLRTIRAAIRQGPANEEHAATLATARQELATARAAYRSTVAGLEQLVSIELSESQRITWDAIKQGLGQRMPLRMIALNDQQRLDLARAERHHRWRTSAALTPVQQTAAVTAHDAAMETILTEQQRAIITAFNDNFEDASAVIAGAYADELPQTQTDG